jgi:hypothetical protein
MHKLKKAAKSALPRSWRLANERLEAARKQFFFPVAQKRFPFSKHI